MHTPAGQAVRLGDVATVTVTPTPTVIEHDGVSRSLDVTSQVQGRDAAEVAAEATSRLQEQTFPFEYRAEVLGDAVERAEAGRQLLLAVVAAAVLAFLLLQAATSSWRVALVLFVVTPLAASGALLADVGNGQAGAGILAALLAVVALTVRQSLGVVRRAQILIGNGGTSAEALRGAAREQSPAVLVTALAVAAAVLPAAVLGGPGLELLQPFAVALLGGLVTAVVVVLFLVPALVVVGGGLRPPPAVGPDAPDGERRAGVVHARHAVHDDIEQEAGAVKRSVRPYGIASLFVAGSLGLAGCQTVAGAEDTAAGPAAVETDAAGGPSRLTLIEEAVGRIGLQTTPVANQGGALTIPYAGVVYDAEGGTWTFVELEPRVYQRAPITIDRVDGGTAVLSAGPQAGTAVVTVGAAELVGVEAGISGGE